MATMFARSTLTVWDASTTGGWSNTSGGASNGTVPINTTDVIFDANSGAARSITLSSAVCNTINTTGSAAMTFISGGLEVDGTSINLTGSVSLNTFQLANTLTLNLTSGGATIGALNSNGTGAITLLSDLVITSSFSVINANFTTNNFNVTAPSFSTTGALTVSMGSGTWTLTGSGTVWSLGAGATITASTSTIKLTDNSATAKQFVDNSSHTYFNFWNATSGSGSVEVGTGSPSFSNFRIDAGRTQKFTSSTTTTVATLTADGTSLPITISASVSGTAATLAKSGGGTITVDSCNIKDITASPISTFRARHSVDQGGNTNWTFVPNNSAFLTFL